MSDWRKVRIDEIAEKIAIGPFGSRMKSDTYTETGVPVIRGTNITGGRSFSGDWVYVSEEDADQLANCNVTEGDLVFPHRGAIGEVGIVPGDRDRYMLSSSLMKLRCDSKKADSLYLFYFFKSHEGRHQLLKNASQVGTPGIGQPLSSLKSIELCLPPLDKQRAIAHILGSLDDKIELNRRTNQTLEAMVRAMFKSWFVDFDPVRAKASGEPSESICNRLGLTPELLPLFPDSFQESELGDIPSGWGTARLEQLTRYLNRGISPKYLEEGGVLVLNQKCVRDGNVDLAKSRRHDPTQKKIDGRTLDLGDVLVNSTGVGTLGRVAQVLAFTESMIVDSHITVVRPDPRKVSWNYLGVALVERQSDIEALGEGSTGQTELSRARLGVLPILLPPQPLMAYFDRYVINLRLGVVSNNAQSTELATLRDSLLPRLISGQIALENDGRVLVAI